MRMKRDRKGCLALTFMTKDVGCGVTVWVSRLEDQWDSNEVPAWNRPSVVCHCRDHPPPQPAVSHPS
ncbi:hypothetical protein ACOMHN_032872 [Nucella lapillus]